MDAVWAESFAHIAFISLGNGGRLMRHLADTESAHQRRLMMGPSLAGLTRRTTWQFFFAYGRRHVTHHKSKLHFFFSAPQKNFLHFLIYPSAQVAISAWENLGKLSGVELLGLHGNFIHRIMFDIIDRKSLCALVHHF
eukprot:GHVP01022630.1.p1 GENE.GHVP01022630.1~~GHVP01022630.1.p1  ORF type:complete len:138 (+),score=2.89 GHVP01022630.1:196-609(+)